MTARIPVGSGRPGDGTASSAQQELSDDTRMADTASETMLDEAGLVAIGRNEGERLQRALTSATRSIPHIVYVDSGSTDGSVAFAEGIGVHALELDMSQPFTAARARNAGLAHLLGLHPGIEYVQFIDGDCMLDEDWVGFALETLRTREELAIVAGLCNEMFPENSVFNRLASLEWNDFVPGEASSCGGNMMVRVRAFAQVGGFNAHMIAGEEPEFCFRLRQAGWKILRVDRPMVQHDIAMFRPDQWWIRCRRGGHAQAEFAYLHRNTEENPKRRENQSSWLLGLFIPGLAFLGAWPSYGLTLLLLLVYPVQVVRVALRLRKRGWGMGDAWLYALHCTLIKVPAMLGQARYHLGRIFGKRSTIIEYK